MNARLHRLAVLVAMAVVIAFGVTNAILALSAPHGNDAAAYWEAAERLRDGELLYPAVTEPDAADAYHYAPWLAWLWVPLTAFPRDAVEVGWSVLLFGVSAAIVVHLGRLRAWPLIAFVGPVFVDTSLTGNVHVLLLAALLFGVERRSGPLWIGLAASLKGFPLVLVLVYAGRRQWLRLGLTVVITAALVAPMWLYDLSQYATRLSSPPERYGLPLIVAGAAVAALVILTPIMARTRYAWLTPSVAMTLALPYAHPYNLQLPLIGLAPRVAAPERGAG
jgi:hypothetical protein